MSVREKKTERERGGERENEGMRERGRSERRRATTLIIRGKGISNNSNEVIQFFIRTFFFQGAMN